MIDYIFYRVYWAYNKKRESAKFLSPLYMAMVFAFLFFPFALFLCELLRDSYHRNDGYLLSIYLLMILIYSYLRFFPNKKIWLINKKFEGNGYNYKIPDWCFFGSCAKVRGKHVGVLTENRTQTIHKERQVRYTSDL